MKASNAGANSSREKNVSTRGHKPHGHASSRGGRPPTKPPLTHFLSLPIGHHPLLRDSISSFTDGLLNASPRIPGLDQSIVIPPRRLHFTLGVMSLTDAVDNSNDDTTHSEAKTLPEALSLLSTLKPRIIEMMQGDSIFAPLNLMNIMKPDDGNPDNAHVLWLGPSFDTEAAQRLRRVGELVFKTFSDAGFIVDRRPLKLHCTLLNTSHRRPRPRGARQPFSYKALLTSRVDQTMIQQPSEQFDYRHPVKVDFGSWEVSEIQICKMGSYGPEGEYVSCGGCSLVP
ncbi:kinase A anchor protein [Hygrophoropsis aurantiaca]|uniref:Kinase A anchor protein n=1 Tax=Hygrophoropsis aurantiaca TaxID=72124 RepID=A0ACB8A129_9AGAM|nr:kinase A anchor protein [Hygrophoropsis aurantiaca]